MSARCGSCPTTVACGGKAGSWPHELSLSEPGGSAFVERVHPDDSDLTRLEMTLCTLRCPLLYNSGTDYLIISISVKLELIIKRFFDFLRLYNIGVFKF